jgi:hypothetical protein
LWSEKFKEEKAQEPVHIQSYLAINQNEEIKNENTNNTEMDKTKDIENYSEKKNS